MRISPLNLISAPVPVLNTLGLNLRVGLSSEDPIVGRHPSETYEAYLSIFSPEGLLVERKHLGQILPERRRYFDISSLTRDLMPQVDHLCVVHRIPARLVSQLSSVDQEIDLPIDPDYSFFRTLIEYSYPQGGNGSLIYETTPRLNAGRSSNTLSFTCQVVLSEHLNSDVILINYSTDPSYSRIADYGFGVFSVAGEEMARGVVTVGPFGIRVLDVAQLIPEHLIARETDPLDGLAAFTFVGYSNDAALLMMIVNAAPSSGSVAVEHTHPPQTYLLPFDLGQKLTVKSDAQDAWKSILSRGGTF